MTWKRLDILRQTLVSYRDNGLLDLSDDVTIFFNEIGEEEIALAKEFNVKYLGNEKNVGIQNAYKSLVDNARNEYFMFLENDWYLVENSIVTKKRLDASIALLEENVVDVVRLRHRIYFGRPCRIVYRNKKNPHLTDKSDLAFVPSISDNPCALFKEITEKKIDDETYYFVGPKNTFWTNNPCIFKTEFIKKMLYLNLPQPTNANKIHKKYKTTIANIAYEGLMGLYWQKSDHTTALSPGLFMHLDYIEDFKPHRKYPAILVQIFTWFVPSEKRRKYFRSKYSR